MADRPDGPAPAAAPSLSIVLAVVNERPNLVELFERLRSLELPPWEAIVADDGSTDGSREFVVDLSAADPRVRALLHDGRQTTLAAQCRAIEAARGRFIVVMDADLQHPPELLPEFVARLEDGAALVIASRYAPGGSPGPRSPLRALISRGAEWTAKLLLPAARPVTDPVSGYFAFRREAFVPLDPGYRGYKLLLFLLVMCRGLDHQEVPFRFKPRLGGASKVTSGPSFVRIFLTELLLARRLSRRLPRRPGIAGTSDPVVG
jgi:dolichol-phosphate mannosyltransferase